MNKKWTKETVFEEAKKYSSKSEFKKNAQVLLRLLMKRDGLLKWNG